MVKTQYRGLEIGYNQDNNTWFAYGIDKKFPSLKKAQEHLDSVLQDKFKKFYLLDSLGVRRLVTDKIDTNYVVDGSLKNLSSRYDIMYIDNAKNRNIIQKIKKLDAKIDMLRGMIKDEKAHMDEFIPE